LPDRLAPEQVAKALRVDRIPVSPAIGRDDGSVWVLSRPPIRIGRLSIVPAHLESVQVFVASDPARAESGSGPAGGGRDHVDDALSTIRLIDAPAFGTGLHPTTALCLELLDEIVPIFPADTMLDVGTGSGVLALAALALGVPRAVGIDTDDEALRAAAANARLNDLDRRLQLSRGGPETLSGTWPLVFANVLAAPLIEMAPPLVRLIGHQGRLVLSGIAVSVEPDVAAAYRRLGMLHLDTRSRAGWVALTLQASW
jgi:ribosomal protein L11 methylase PrmA